MPSLEGQSAPAFALPGSDDATHRLDALRGRTVVLFFYPKDDTPGCTKEACGFRDAHADLMRLGAAVYGVSADGLESHRAFLEKYRLPFVLLSDPSRETMKAYGAYGEKILYGKPVVGVIRSTVVIDGAGRVVKHWQKVPQAETHPEAVLAFLRARAAG